MVRLTSTYKNILLRLVPAAALLSCLTQADRSPGHVYHVLGQGKGRGGGHRSGHGGDWVTRSSVGYVGEYDQRINEGYSKEESRGHPVSNGYKGGHGSDHVSGHVDHTHNHGYGHREPHNHRDQVTGHTSLRGGRQQDSDGYGTDHVAGRAPEGTSGKSGRGHGDRHNTRRDNNSGKSRNDMYDSDRYASGFGDSHSSKYDNRYGHDMGHSHKTEYGNSYSYGNHHIDRPPNNDYGVVNGISHYEGHVPFHQGHNAYSCGGYWKGVIGRYGNGHAHGDGYGEGHTHHGYSCGGYWKGITGGYGKGYVRRSTTHLGGGSGYGNTIRYDSIYREDYDRGNNAANDGDYGILYDHSAGKVHVEGYDSEHEGVAGNSYAIDYKQRHKPDGRYKHVGTFSEGNGYVRPLGNGGGYAPGLRHGSRAVYGYVYDRGNEYNTNTRYGNDRRHERVGHSDNGYRFGERRRNNNIIGYVDGHHRRHV